MKTLRELKIKLSFDGNAAGELKKTNSEVDALKAKFEPLLQKLPPDLARTADGAEKLNDKLRETGKTLGRLRGPDGKFLPKIPPMPELDKATNAMAELAKATGHSEKTLQALIDKSKKELHLEEQFKKAASAVGLTKDEVDKLNSKLKNAEATSATFVNVFKGLAALGVTAAAFSFANKAVEESNRAENALIGFKTVVKNALGADQLDETTMGVEKLFKKLGGSMDMSSIQMSVKNLLNSGFSASQAIELVEKNAYMASVNRQRQFKTIAEAVQTYTEGIKNNNAMLTDSTGISENLSVTLKKKGLSMDDLNNSTKRALVLQTIYNSHTQEAGLYLDAYTQQMEGYQGQVIKANSAMSKILETTGNFIKSALTPLLAMANPVLAFFSDAERGSTRTFLALTLLTFAIGVGMVGALMSLDAALLSVAASQVKAFAGILVPALGIAAALTAVYLILEDIYIFFEYGPAKSETYFGDLLSWLGLTELELRELSDGFQAIKSVFVDAWKVMSDALKDPAFKIALAAIAFGILLVVAPVMLVTVALFALKVALVVALVAGIAFVIARWDVMTKWMQSAFAATVEFLKKAAILAGKIILTALFPLAGLYIFRNEIKAVFEWLWNMLKNTDLGKFFIDEFMKMKSSLANSLSGIFESAKGWFTNLIPTEALNKMIDAVNYVLTKLNSFSASSVVQALGMSPLNLELIPHLEKRELGGPVSAGIPYLVGERGPEIRMFDKPGSIIPNNRLNEFQPVASSGSGGNSFQFSVSINSASPDYDAYALYDKFMELINGDSEKAKQRAELGVSVG